MENFRTRHSVTCQTIWTFTVIMFSGSHAILRGATFSCVMSVCPHRFNSVLTVRITMKLSFEIFFQNLLRKLTFYSNMIRITGTLYEDLSTFMAPFCILLGARIVSGKKFSIYIFPESCFLWDNVDKTRNTLSRFHGNNGHTNASKSNVYIEYQVPSKPRSSKWPLPFRFCEETILLSPKQQMSS
jgi:hypothetical protein